MQARPIDTGPVTSPAAAGQPQSRLRAAWRSDLPERYLVPAVAATIPLEFTKLFFPLQIIELSRVLMVIGLVILVARAVERRERIALPRARSLVPISLLLVYALVSAIVTRSSSGLKEAAASIIYLAVALLVFNWTRTIDGQRRVWMALFLSGIVVSVIGTLLHVFHGYIWNPDQGSGYHRSNSTFADPNIYARFLIFMLAASLVTAWEWLRPRETRTAIAAGLTAALGIPFTFSRFGWVLAAFIGVLALAVTRTKRKAAVLAAGMLLLFGIAILADQAVLARGQLLGRNLTSTVTNAPAGTTVLEGKVPYYMAVFLRVAPLDSTRRYLILAGMAMFTDHPLFGVGYGNFQKRLQTDYSSYKPAAYRTTLEHTTVVGIAAELGLVGLVLLLWIIVELVLEWRTAFSVGGLARPLALATGLGIVTIFISSQIAGRLLSEPYLWLFLGLIYALRAVDVRSPSSGMQPAGAPAGR